MDQLALTGTQKAAVLMLSLGPDLSAQILKHMSDDQIQRLAMEMINLQGLPPAVQTAVLDEARGLAKLPPVRSGGASAAKLLLTAAMGEAKANELLDRAVQSSKDDAPFAFVDAVEPGQLAGALKEENPQTIALVLSNVRPSVATVVLGLLPAGVQTNVTARIAMMDRTPPEALLKVEQGLRLKLAATMEDNAKANAQQKGKSSSGGVDRLVAILGEVDETTEKSILDSLEVGYPQLAEQVRRKLFTFENLVRLDDRAIQRVLREVDSKDLSLSLKGASEAVKAKIFKNMSTRSAEMLTEELSMTGPVRLKQVEEAQDRVVEIILRLAQNQEIVIPRGGKGDAVV